MNSVTMWEIFLASEVISFHPVRIAAEITYTEGIMPPEFSPGERAHFPAHRRGGLEQWFLFFIGLPNNAVVAYTFLYMTIYF